MERTAVALPQDLLDRLRADAERADRGISTEIRQRLQLTYDLEQLPRDPETAELVECIKTLAANLAGDLSMKWDEHAYVLAAFKAGIAAFLAEYTPKGDANVRTDARVVGELSDPPEAVGRTHARLILISRRGR
jgi:hypothetical protein